MYKFISSKMEFFLIIFGIILCSSSTSSFIKIRSGIENIKTIENLEQYVGKYVEIDSKIVDTGYYIEKRSTREKEVYYYLGSVNNKPFFIFSNKYLSSNSQITFITSSTKLVGFFESNTKSFSNKNFVNTVCKDLKLDQSAFNSKFTPYIFRVEASGENASFDCYRNKLTDVVFSIGIILAGIIMLIVKLKKPKLS